jgi:hypothetical protein
LTRKRRIRTLALAAFKMPTEGTFYIAEIDWDLNSGAHGCSNILRMHMNSADLTIGLMLFSATNSRANTASFWHDFMEKSEMMRKCSFS